MQGAKITRIRLCDTDVQYKVCGSGRAVILLHGWGCNMTTVASIETMLSPHFTVYTLDFPGFGGSETPSSVWGVEEYTRMLETFVAALGIESPILIGHSFGGRVSILYASRNHTHKVILVDAAGAKPRRSLKYYYKVYTYKLGKQLLYLILGKEKAEQRMEKMRRSAGSADYNAVSGMMRRIFVKVVNEYLESVMPPYQMPRATNLGSQRYRYAIARSTHNVKAHPSCRFGCHRRCRTLFVSRQSLPFQSHSNGFPQRRHI